MALLLSESGRLIEMTIDETIRHCKDGGVKNDA